MLKKIFLIILGITTLSCTNLKKVRTPSNERPSEEIENLLLELNFTSQVSKENQEILKDDLIFLSTLKTSAINPLQSSTFFPKRSNSTFGITLLNFVVSRTKVFDFGKCGSKYALACSYQNEGRTVLTPLFFQLDKELRLVYLLHETWHHETPNIKHVLCTSGPEKGLRACDTEIFGAYGFVVSTFADLAKFCLSCTEKERSMFLYSSVSSLAHVTAKDSTPLTEARDWCPPDTKLIEDEGVAPFGLWKCVSEN